MMFLSSRRIEKYYVLKLFKLTSKEVSFVDAILFWNSIFEDISNEMLNYFELNYGEKSWKSVSELKRNKDSISNYNFLFFVGASNKNKCSFSISNNYNDRKNKNSIEIVITIKEELSSYGNLIEILKNFNKIFEINYGYILTLTEDFDFDSERKLKKGLFGSKQISIRDEDLEWNNKLFFIKEGEIRKIYPINFMNKSQIESKLVKSLINEKKIFKKEEMSHNLVVMVQNS